MHQIEDIVDFKVGIVRYVRESHPEPGAPSFFHYFAKACNTHAFCAQENFSNAGGASISRESAIRKAIGEAVERYCAAIYDVDEFPLTTYANATFPAVAPSDWSLYGDLQYAATGFPWAPFNDHTCVRWTRAWDATHKTQCYVPAAMVHVPYVYLLGSGDTPIVQPMSTGLACHQDLIRAAVSGACEVIERDAFTLTWQAMMEVPKIRKSTLPKIAKDTVARFDRTDCTVTLFDITTDVQVPTILAIGRSEAASAPALVFSAATALDPFDAVQKCLEELAHTRRYSKQIKESHSSPQELAMLDSSDVVDQQSHLRFYCDQRNTSHAAFLLRSDNEVDFDDLPNNASHDPVVDLRTIIRVVDRAGHRLIIADLTTVDVRDAELRVCRVLIPGMHPLFVGHNIRALGGRRLWTVPQKMGYRGVYQAVGDNPAPHGFP